MKKAYLPSRSNSGVRIACRALVALLTVIGRSSRSAKKRPKKLKSLRPRFVAKTKALAETSALLVLSKKLEALYGDEPDNEDD